MMEKDFIETDSLMVATARANRLRRLRNLANLSRKEVCQDSDINLNTLIGWEVARHGGLTQSGAQKFLKRILQAGIICSEEWLLEGKGADPYIIPSINLLSETGNAEVDTQLQKILSEMELFKKHYPNSVSMIINDESMLPFFKKGDFICGCIIPPEDIRHYLGTACIVLIPSGKQLLRNIIINKADSALCLLADNLSAESQEPLVLQDIKPLYIAPVIWHRKLLKSY